MDKIKRINFKEGNICIICISIISVFFILMFSIIFVLYSQINVIVYSIKYDINNVVQNVCVSFDNEELSYYNYVLNESDMFEKVESIISLNYDNVKLKYLNYDKEENEVNINVDIIINPIFFIKERKVELKERVKIKLMEIEDIEY